jgi:hypothetical protein
VRSFGVITRMYVYAIIFVMQASICELDNSKPVIGTNITTSPFALRRGRRTRLEGSEHHYLAVRMVRDTFSSEQVPFVSFETLANGSFLQPSQASEATWAKESRPLLRPAGRTNGIRHPVEASPRTEFSNPQLADKNRIIELESR